MLLYNYISYLIRKITYALNFSGLLIVNELKLNFVILVWKHYSLNVRNLKHVTKTNNIFENDLDVEVLTTVIVKIIVVWDMTWCSFYRLREACYPPN